jgi:hypothetical protein
VDPTKKTRRHQELWKLFEYKPEIEKFQCTLCPQALVGASNVLKRHVENLHKDVFKNLTQYQVPRIDTQSKKITKGITKQKMKPLPVYMDKETLLKAAVELCTKDHVPLNLFNKPAMRKITDPYCDSISRVSEENFTLNTELVRKNVILSATAIRQKLTDELKNQMISIKVDGASRGPKHIFGINAQFMVNGILKVRTLSVAELDTTSRATDLSAKIISVLEQYGVDLKQVVSLTSDNGSNMILTGKILSNISEPNFEEHQADSGAPNQCNDVYLKELQAYIEDGCQFCKFNVATLQVVRCAAHTVQLCAMDLMNVKAVREMVLNVRNIVKHIKKSSTNENTILKALKVKFPGLDGATRWLSTFTMIKELAALKEVLIENSMTTMVTKDGVVTLDSEFWAFVEAYVKAMSHVEKTIIDFQRQDLNFGDFYVKWILMKLLIDDDHNEMLISDTDNPFQTVFLELLSSIAKREKALLDNEILGACLYLDPRFQVRFVKFTQIVNLLHGKYSHSINFPSLQYCSLITNH